MHLDAVNSELIQAEGYCTSAGSEKKAEFSDGLLLLLGWMDALQRRI